MIERSGREHIGDPPHSNPYLGALPNGHELWKDRRPWKPGSSATGQQALAAGDWPAARAAFEEALADTETAEALDGLGQVLWWQNEPGEAIELRQRAYAEFVRRGDSARAIGIAVFLAREFFMLHGNFAAMTGLPVRRHCSTSRGIAPMRSGSS